MIDPTETDNETWIIEAGDAVIQKEARVGIRSLTPWETLVYCIWVADYGMRNAGDLDTAEDLHSGFQSDARRNACELSLPLTQAAFSLPKSDLEEQYFDRFDAMIDEVRRAFTGSDTNGK